MSIKIWQAWRVPIGRLNEFMVMVNETTMAEFYRKFNDWMSWIDLKKAKQVREKMKIQATELRICKNCKRLTRHAVVTKPSSLVVKKVVCLDKKHKGACHVKNN